MPFQNCRKTTEVLCFQGGPVVRQIKDVPVSSTSPRGRNLPWVPFLGPALCMALCLHREGSLNRAHLPPSSSSLYWDIVYLFIVSVDLIEVRPS